MIQTFHLALLLIFSPPHNFSIRINVLGGHHKPCHEATDSYATLEHVLHFYTYRSCPVTVCTNAYMVSQATTVQLYLNKTITKNSAAGGRFVVAN